MERKSATFAQTGTDHDKVDRALLTLARLFGEAAAAEMRDKMSTLEAADNGPKDT